MPDEYEEDEYGTSMKGSSGKKSKKKKKDKSTEKSLGKKSGSKSKGKDHSKGKDKGKDQAPKKPAKPGRSTIVSAKFNKVTKPNENDPTLAQADDDQTNK